ncbi:MAG: aspartate--ammonia ligase [Bacillales bacterium]|jgi:aspartate--ammonia ligase|nr:aspartate--ammonia ligase [Bacillales bacterium]
MEKGITDYKSLLDIRQTEIAIKQIKDYFERCLADTLNLTRVSAPLYVMSNTGINDNLNGSERPVSFDVKDLNYKHVEIVHSLAKWKRVALKRYGFSTGEGLYTDMNAIRRDEEMDALHSIYVDQWDWELVLTEKERTIEKLKTVVDKIFAVFKNTAQYLINLYPDLNIPLPDKIYFLTSEELLQMYPDLSPKEREDAITEKHKAVFIIQIGDKLSNRMPHDLRSPDYDDWQLNGDILFWYPVLNKAFEVSSMGIRVDAASLKSQLQKSNVEDRLQLPFHQGILNEELPFTIGGGIGQSRICMFFLNKAHIGEVQASVWPEEMVQDCHEKGMFLL